MTRGMWRIGAEVHSPSSSRSWAAIWLRSRPSRIADAKPVMWAKMAEVWPDYDQYQTKTSREIPVVVLERA